MLPILLSLAAGYLLWITAYLWYERIRRRNRREKEERVLPRKTADSSQILGKSTFSLSHSTPQAPEIPENEKAADEADTFAPETEKYPKTVSPEELDELFAESDSLPEGVELMDVGDEPLAFRETENEPPIDEDEQEQSLEGCTPQATGIRFEDMGLAVRVAVSGEAADEGERLKAGRTLAELRGTPMFDTLTAGDAEREKRIAQLIDLHLATFRKQRRTADETPADTVPADFSIDDIV